MEPAGMEIQTIEDEIEIADGTLSAGGSSARISYAL
jgi:hypothetical protein